MDSPPQERERYVPAGEREVVEVAQPERRRSGSFQVIVCPGVLANIAASLRAAARSAGTVVARQSAAWSSERWPQASVTSTSTQRPDAAHL